MKLVFELLILTVMLMSAGTGFIRGMVREVFHFSSWIVTLILIWIFIDPISLWFSAYLSQSLLQKIAAFGLIFVVSMIVCWVIIHFIIFRLLSIQGVTFSDRLLGLGIGILRGLVLIGLMLALGVIFTVDQNQWWQQSLITKVYEPLIHIWVSPVSLQSGS